MTTRLLDRIQGCLLGAMIGDAMGMPWEGMDLFGIMNVIPLGVTGFTTPGEHSLPFLRQLKAGDTTDDWALTRANARALIRGKGDYVPKLIAEEHLAEFHRSTVGWGRTTKRAMEELEVYGLTQRALGRGPDSSAGPDPDHPKSGCGNGVAMKVAPLAIVHVLGHGAGTLDVLGQMVVRHGRLTHPDPRASIAAAGIAYLIMRALTSPNEPPVDDWPASWQIEEVAEWLRTIEQALPAVPPDDRFTGRLSRILDCPENLLDPSNRQITAQDLAFVLGNGYHALESCAFAMAMALRHADDFRQAMLNTVNAGGDTDTNASMVGAMVGARVGLSGIPEEWRTFSPTFQEAVELADQLYALK